MHAHTVRPFHLPHRHLDLRRLGRDALVVAALAVSATAVTASERAFRTPGHGPEAAAVQEVATVVAVPLGVEVRVEPLGVLAIVRGFDSSAVNAVSLVNEQGAAVVPQVTTVDGARFVDVPVGRYRIVASSEGPIEHAGDSAISSAVVVRSEPFMLLSPGPVVVESR